MHRQAAALDALIRPRMASDARSVMDVSCGVGTQSLGLAALGYDVSGADLSRAAVERARREAAARGLRITFDVADMRGPHAARGRAFDVVLCADNSLPHLLNDDDIACALSEMHALTRPGGITIITLGDYESEPRGGRTIRPYGIREREGKRYVVFQTWDWRGDCYDLALYIVEDDSKGNARRPCSARLTTRSRSSA